MAEVNPFLGNWSYRSYVNDPNFATQPNDLLFGMGTLNLAESADGKVAGSIGGERWVYDYLGYLVPDWPTGIGQRSAIVGSVIRTVAHSNGQATAGFVASFIAVKQD